MNINLAAWRTVFALGVMLAVALGGCSEDATDANGGSGGASGSGGGAWATLGSGMDWPVQALVIGSDGALYAGGRFNEAGGVEAKFVAKWDGQKWSAMPGKFSMDVTTLAIYDDGSGPALHTFTSEGGGLRLSKWTGEKWMPLSDPVNGTPNVLKAIEVGGKKLLFAGGNILGIGQVSLGNFAQWDGKTWAQGLGSSFNNVVYSIAPMDGKIAVGGWMKYVLYGTEQTDAEVPRIALWEGDKWISPGGGIGEGTVEALAAFDDGSGAALYAAGDFQEAGGQTARNIARWDGKTWQELGGGIEGMVHAMTTIETAQGPRLIVGGEFSQAGATEAANIAMWDGKQWTALGEGVDGAVRALAAHDGTLYVGGDFSQAGGKEANRIAKWSAGK